jgi:hypothetical protein
MLRIVQRTVIFTAACGMLVSIGGFAAATPLVLPQGTDVTLAFDQALNSKTAKTGQHVRMHVKNNVSIGRHLVIRAGTRVMAQIEQVDKAHRYGTNARIKLTMRPVRSTYGELIPLEPRQKGKIVGRKTSVAAALTAGGAILLGPVGLVGGYFINGKSVKIKVGDKLETQVTHDVTLTTK